MFSVPYQGDWGVLLYEYLGSIRFKEVSVPYRGDWRFLQISYLHSANPWTEFPPPREENGVSIHFEDDKEAISYYLFPSPLEVTGGSNEPIL